MNFMYILYSIFFSNYQQPWFIVYMWYINKRDAMYIVLFHSSPGAIPASMIPTPIPADLDSDSNSSHLGYDSDSDSNIIFMNDSNFDSYSIQTRLRLQK